MRHGLHFSPGHADTFCFWKGRVAFYAILKALGVGPGDEVVVPGFTCVVVPNAVLYTGAKPVYADIDPETLNVTRKTLAACTTRFTRLIVVQNTFGLSPDLLPILEFAEERGVWVVEDCAHGLGGFYRDEPNGSWTDAAFFSTQWSKPVSTGLGGIAVTRDRELTRRVGELQKAMLRPSALDVIMLAVQLLLRPLANTSTLWYPAIGAYRILTQELGITVGSADPSELAGVEMPDDYRRKMSRLQAWLLKRRLPALPEKVEERRRIAARYDEVLEDIGLVPPSRPDYAYHSMLRYAFRVPDKRDFLRRARNAGIPVGDWFVSPLHPIEEDLDRWGYFEGACPSAEAACREVVNLFTSGVTVSERGLRDLLEPYR